MTKRLIVTGRGGTGKSTFAALTVKSIDKTPLIIDADPDQCLSSLLGVNLEEKGVITVSEAMYRIQKGETDQSVDSMPLSQKIDYLMQFSCLYESSEFDLLTLGVKWTRGCYCAPNNALRTLISELASNYEYSIFDSPAGLEHINRRIISRADDVFAIVDPSTKALRNVERIMNMADTVDFSYNNLYTVANYRFPAENVERLQKMEGDVEYLGKVDSDSKVEEFDWSGRSLLELPQDSPAYVSVRGILDKAGRVS